MISERSFDTEDWSNSLHHRNKLYVKNYIFKRKQIF